MQDVLYIEEFDQASTLMKPLRIEIIKRMAEPCTCQDLAEALDESPQKIYYHVKALQNAGLVEKVEERRVRGIMEGIYQARARSYWLSPEIAGRVGGRRKAQDQMSLGFLYTLAEELQADVGRLAEVTDQPVPSLGLDAMIQLRDGEHRAEFMRDLQGMFQQLSEKYGNTNEANDPSTGQSFRIAFACYPKPFDPGSKKSQKEA